MYEVVSRYNSLPVLDLTDEVHSVYRRYSSSRAGYSCTAVVVRPSTRILETAKVRTCNNNHINTSAFATAIAFIVVAAFSFASTSTFSSASASASAFAFWLLRCRDCFFHVNYI